MDKQTVIEASKLLDKRTALLRYKDDLIAKPLELSLDRTLIRLTQSAQTRLRETLIAEVSAEITAIERTLHEWGVEL